MKKLDIFIGDYNKVKRNHKQEGAKQGILLGAFLSFFGMLWYFAPIGVYPDSGAYVSMQAGREPLYPLFLAFFRWIFREGDTLIWLAGSGQLDSEKALELMQVWPALNTAMLVQSLLAALACFFLAMVIRRLFLLNWTMTVLTALCTLIPYVLTPLASASHMVLNKAILTEGLSFPLFFFFAGFMVLGFLSEEKKYPYYGGGLFSCVLLVLTRNQMLVFFAVWCAVILLEGLRERKKGYILLLLGGIIFCLGCKNAANRGYNNFVHAEYAGASTGSYNILTTLLYLSDVSDAEKLSDASQRELFLKMHALMEEEGMTLADAPDRILGRAYHYENCYDLIGFEIQQPVLFGYVEKLGVPDDAALNEVIRITSRMCRELFPALTGAYISNYSAAVVSGLTRSISASGQIMGIYSAIVYLLAVILMVYLYKRDKKSRAAHLVFLVLLMICANVFGTAVMIMCLSRYMIYNTALFYIAGLMSLRELYLTKRHNTME